jgi:hypothetical protein
MRTRFRRWRKSFSESRSIFGLRGAILQEVWQHARPLMEIIWWVRYRTTRRYHVLNLGTKPGYSDVTERLIHANFALLVHFVEMEEPFVHLNWDSDPEHQHAASEIKRLYAWWKEVFPFYDKHDPLHQESVKLPRRVFEPYGVDDDGDPTSYTWEVIEEDKEIDKAFGEACKASHEYEAKRDKEIEDNLIALIKIRQFLWT